MLEKAFGMNVKMDENKVFQYDTVKLLEVIGTHYKLLF